MTCIEAARLIMDILPSMDDISDSFSDEFEMMIETRVTYCQISKWLLRAYVDDDPLVVIDTFIAQMDEYSTKNIFTADKFARMRAYGQEIYDYIYNI